LQLICSLYTQVGGAISGGKGLSRCAARGRALSCYLSARLDPTRGGHRGFRAGFRSDHFGPPCALAHSRDRPSAIQSLAASSLLKRSIGDLQDIVRAVRARGASLKATEQPIDTSTAAGKCFLDMLGVFAKFETNLRRERQLEGIAKAKAADVYRGGRRRSTRHAFAN
jgi:Resolvase, N terminal domain